MTPTHSTIRHIQDDRAEFAVLELTVRIPSLHTAQSVVLHDLYAELLMAGSGTFTRSEFLDAVAQTGAHLSVSSQAELLSVHIRSRSHILPRVLSLLADMLLKPRFIGSELTRIKKRYAEELKLATENAPYRAYTQFASRCFSPTDRRYEHEPDALSREISSIRVPDVRALHARMMQTPTYIATIGGNARDSARIAKAVRGIFMPSSPWSLPDIPLRSVSGRNTIWRDIPHKQNIEITMGAPVSILGSDTQYPALYFGICVLGIKGGFSGRLMSIVREKEGLTYGIYAQLDGVTMTERGLWKICTFFSPKDVVRGVSATFREIDRIREEGITSVELARFKSILNTRFQMVHDSLMRRVREAHGLALQSMDESHYDTFKQSLAELTVEDVHMALSTHLSTSTIVVSGAGPTHAIQKELTQKIGEYTFAKRS